MLDIYFETRGIKELMKNSILKAATTSPPLSFPKSYIAFSKSKQDVWLRLVLAMDGQQEPVRYKSNLLFGLESDSVSVSFGYFSLLTREK